MIDQIVFKRRILIYVINIVFAVCFIISGVLKLNTAEFSFTLVLMILSLLVLFGSIYMILKPYGTYQNNILTIYEAIGSTKSIQLNQVHPDLIIISKRHISIAGIKIYKIQCKKTSWEQLGALVLQQKENPAANTIK